MADAAIDNDVILKGASYGFLADLLASLPNAPHRHGALGAARFMLPKRLSRRPVIRQEAALADLRDAFDTLDVLEPNEIEQRLAAEWQFNAQKANLPLDAGEAQLAAMVVTRELRHLLTGDKRAIKALSLVPIPATIDREQLAGKLICLEQAVRWLVERQGATGVRAAVCAEREVDAQLRLCFSCSAPEVGEPSWLEGLQSSIDEVRAAGPDLLAAN